MLKNLDVVLAFASIMLMLSLIITTVVQAMVSLINLRGRNLVKGVSNLFQQMDPAFKKAIADELSHKLLGHPAVARWSGRVTQAISKEEFVRLAVSLANRDTVSLTAEAKAALQTYLDKTVISLPMGQQIALSRVAEALPAPVAASFNDAVANVAGSVQKIGVDVAEWFDTVLDRTRDTFTVQTRVITSIAAVALALGLHIDSPYLIRQLSANDEARNQLVAQVQPLLDRAAQANVAQTTPEEARARVDEIKAELAATNLDIFADWSKVSYAGMAMTAVFLSLGAPFWFNTLRRVSNLRPSIARVVDPK